MALATSDPIAARDRLLPVLETLLAAVHVPYEVEETYRAVSRALAERSELRPGELLDVVAELAPQLGLHVKRVRIEPAHLNRIVSPRLPILFEGRDARSVYAALESDTRQIWVTSGTESEGEWRHPSALSTELGAGEPGEPLDLLTVEAAAPMSELSHAGAKHGDPKTALRRLRALLTTEREDLRAIYVYAIGAGLFTLTIPIAVQTLVNTVAFGTLLQPLLVLTILVIGGLVLYGVLTALEVYLVELLQRRLLARVVGDLAYRMPRARTSAMDHVYGPEQLNRFFDVFTVHKASAQLLVDGLDLALKALVGLLLLAFYHPFLLAFDVVLIGALCFVVFALGRGGNASSIIESKKKYKLAGWLEELGRRPELFKAPGGLRLARDRADAHLRDFLHARMDHFRVVMRQTIGSLAIYALASGSLLGLGGFLVMQGQLTLGQLVAAELVLTTVVTAFAKMGKHAESFYDLVAGLDKLGALFDMPVEVSAPASDPVEPTANGSKLELRDVRLQRGSRPILDETNVVVEPGQRVAFLGGSGSGKSAFADLVYGLRPPSSGTMRLDGRHVEDIPLNLYRQRVAVARPHDVFNATVQENVRLGDASIDVAQVREALELVELGEVVQKFEHGLSEEVFPDGRPFTQAETARLSLARAVASRPSLLVIDGLLDLQDDAVRKKIIERLSAPENPWTLILLTRVEVVARALPRCFRLERGHTMDLGKGTYS